MGLLGHVSARSSKSRGSSSVRELVAFLDPHTSVPARLYPGGRRVTAITRIAQIAFGWVRFLALVLNRRPMAIIHGHALAYTRGWVQISTQHPWQLAITSAIKPDPFLPVRMSPDHARMTFDRIGIDSSPTLLAYPHENNHIVFRGHRHGRACIVHYGSSPSSIETVKRHATGLRSAHITLGAVLPGLIPEILHYNESNESILLIEQQIPGMSPLLDSQSESQLLMILTAGLKPLQQIYFHSSKMDYMSTKTFIDSELHRLNDILPKYRHYIMPALRSLQTWATDRKIPSVPTHGDYAPRNLFFNSDLSQVKGIIDWEWFCACGPVGFDALKFLLEMQAASEGVDLFWTLHRFIQFRTLTGPWAFGISLLCDSFSLSKRDLWHIAILIWLHVLWVGCVVTDPDNEQWIRNAFSFPANAITHH